MSNKVNYKAGDIYGRLILTGKSYMDTSRTQPRRYVEWICSCTDVIGWSTFDHIKSGHTNSCGCYKNDKRIEAKTKHGLHRHILYYSIWHGIKNRCYNVNDIPYPDYGGRGIKVCDEWLSDFINFYKWAISNGYKKGLVIDRINNNGDYEPSNCRFTTNAINQRNKRNNVYLEAFGETRCVSDWVMDKRCTVSFGAIINRLRVMSWDNERAISTPNTSFNISKKILH